MTRAVIKLKQDLTDALPVIARAVENSAYNDITHVVSFRYNDLGVIVYQKEIIVLGADNENKAIEVIDFLKSIIGNNQHKEQ